MGARAGSIGWVPGFALSFALVACGGGDSSAPAAGPDITQQQAYVKASNTGPVDAFGTSIALSSDGNTLAVGAPLEASAVTGVGGDQNDDTAPGAGAVYVFTRSAIGVWTQQAYIKASNTGAGDGFGISVTLSADGNTLAVGAQGEDSAATGIDGNQADESAIDAGAVYVFTRSGANWIQQAYLKASNTQAGDELGVAVALSGDGNTLATGARGEDSATTGTGGNQADESATDAGAVYVFTRSGAVWTQQAYVKASNTGAVDQFGSAVTLSNDGGTLAVGARNEDSAATGIGGNQADNTASSAGAVYVFTRSGATWTQQAYLKASNAQAADEFGVSVALSGDGNTLAVGAQGEDSAATGVGGIQADNSALSAGAAYVFARSGAVWTQQAYVKASNSGTGDNFGFAIALSGNGAVLAVGARKEDSAAIEIGGIQGGNSAVDAGAVYYFSRSGAIWTQQAYVKASNTQAGDEFGGSIALNGNGTTLAAGANREASAATGIGGNQSDNTAANAGAVYLFQ